MRVCRICEYQYIFVLVLVPHTSKMKMLFLTLFSRSLYKNLEFLSIFCCYTFQGPVPHSQVLIDLPCLPMLNMCINYFEKHLRTLFIANVFISVCYHNRSCRGTSVNNCIYVFLRWWNRHDFAQTFLAIFFYFTAYGHKHTCHYLAMTRKSNCYNYSFLRVQHVKTCFCFILQ